MYTHLTFPQVPHAEGDTSPFSVTRCYHFRMEDSEEAFDDDDELTDLTLPALYGSEGYLVVEGEDQDDQEAALAGQAEKAADAEIQRELEHGTQLEDDIRQQW
jgi:hypothetical protein